MQRLQSMFGDVERRLTERLERVVERTSGQHAEAATIQFAEAIKSSREEAGRRLSRPVILSGGRSGDGRIREG